MAAPTTAMDFLDHVRVSCLVEGGRLDTYLDSLRSQDQLPDEPRFLAGRLVRDGLLTSFQAQQLLQGRHRNFVVGKYKLLQPLGAGGMSKVFLCEHQDMGHRVAMKILTKRRGTDPAVVARFFREARLIASLDHPNIVRAHDIDCSDDKFHYIIMDYIEGVPFNELVRRRGALNPHHAAHYIAQTASGLHYIHETGLMHRDIKPGNLLLDREGVVKILDLGLARFQEDQDKITERYNDNSILGTADFISPEQTLVGKDVDARADIYSLGATFYFLLTGQVPYPGGSIADKIIGHQTRMPLSVRQIKPDVPEDLEQIQRRMMAKSRRERYQSAGDVIRALERWLELEVPPPIASELPALGRAALGSSHNGIRRPMSSGYLAAARAAISAPASIAPANQVQSAPPAPTPASDRNRWLAIAFGAIALAAVTILVLNWFI